MLKRKYYIFIFCFIFFVVSCIEKEKKIITYLQNTCITTEPVYNCVNIYERDDDKISENYRAPNLQEAISSLEDRAKADKMHFEFELLVFDSTVSFVTAFNRQRVLFIGKDCLDSLEFPQKVFSNDNQSVRKIENLSFKEVENRKIPDYGNCKIYHYFTNEGPTNSSPTNIYVFIQEEVMGKYPKHFIFYSRGMEWQKLPNGYSAPYFVNITRSSNIKVLLAFDGDRFIPIGSGDRE